MITDWACSIDGCERPRRTRGWCQTHYVRWHRWGSPDVVKKLPQAPVDTCSVDGCDRRYAARGYCTLHWQRWKRDGEPGPAYVPESEEDRFRAQCKPVESGCWEWQGRPSKGYGKFKTCTGKTVRAHVYSYRMHVGEIAEGLQLDHLCRNTMCVNPEHLEAVTPRVNTLRGYSFAAENAAKTHCIRGHPFDEANTRRYLRGTGWHRACRACAARYKRSRAA